MMTSGSAECSAGRPFARLEKGDAAMAKMESPYCPECDEAFAFPEPLLVNRRNFIRVVGGAAAAVALGAAGSGQGADQETRTAKKVRPAEELIKELFSGLKDEQ